MRFVLEILVVVDCKQYQRCNYLRDPRAPHHGDLGCVGEDGRSADGAVVADRPEIHLVHVEVERWSDLTSGDKRVPQQTRCA